MRPSRGRSDYRICGLAFGYFAFYTPYSGLTRAVSQGLLPGRGGATSGLAMMPAVTLGTSAVMLAIVAARRALRRETHADPGPGPRPFGLRPVTLASGLATAVIIGTTTLNFTFTGVSILLALLLMRGGVLILAPVVDLASGRRVSGYSWAALGFSLVAITVALTGVSGPRMTWLAWLNIAGYLGGYVVRLNLMSRRAKDPDPAVNARFFDEEALVAAVALAAVPALLALLGPWGFTGALRAGFAATFAAPWAWPELLIGLLYGCLYQFGTWIYLDERENTFCIPLNRGSSLLSGVVASCAIAWLTGQNPPHPREFVGVALILMALVSLTMAIATPRLPSLLAPAQRVFLFVCDGNTSRSPMAQAICNDEIARRLGLAAGGPDSPVIALSAGLTATAGRPFSAASVEALGRLGVTPHDHVARELTADLVGRAERIYCMTEAQRVALIDRFPGSESKVRRLDAERDIDDPKGQGDDAYVALGDRLRRLVASSLPNLTASPA